MSCEGLESPNYGQVFEEIKTSEDAFQLNSVSQTPQWDCRAAPGSQQQPGRSAPICAREHAQITAEPNTSGDSHATNDGEQSFQGGHEQLHKTFAAHRATFSEPTAPTSGIAHGTDYLSILGGAASFDDTWGSATQRTPTMQNYATATDCILQNLTMTVGNPSVRCFANAPWRAFTWVCALLQETSSGHPNSARFTRSLETT